VRTCPRMPRSIWRKWVSFPSRGFFPPFPLYFFVVLIHTHSPSSNQNVVEINRPPLPVYQNVIEKTRQLTIRTQALGVAIARSGQGASAQQPNPNTVNWFMFCIGLDWYFLLGCSDEQSIGSSSMLLFYVARSYQSFSKCCVDRSRIMDTNWGWMRNCIMNRSFR